VPALQWVLCGSLEEAQLHAQAANQRELAILLAPGACEAQQVEVGGATKQPERKQQREHKTKQVGVLFWGWPSRGFTRQRL
jgi:hypothetical protein